MNLPRLIIQAVIVITPVLWRSFTKAYAQAAARAPEYGRIMSQVNVKRIQPMTVSEAAKILNISESPSELPKLDYAKMFKTYHKLMKANERSFYLQSKVFRARETLDMELRKAGYEFPSNLAEMERDLMQDLKGAKESNNEKKE